MSRRRITSECKVLRKQLAIDAIRELAMDDMNWKCDYLDWHNKKQLAAQRSYEQWALEELILHIEKSNKSPIPATEEFAEKMDNFACMSGNLMFSIAYDTALYALDTLLLAE